jgi:hypothetical protein
MPIAHLVSARRRSDACQRSDAALCLIGGDLSDKGTAEALIAVRDLSAAWAFRCAVPGNHDYLAQTDRTECAIFPDKLNYRFMHKGWQFIDWIRRRG